MGKVRHARKARTRSSNTQDYSQRCKCKFHDVYHSLDLDKERDFRTYSRSSNDYKKSHLDWLEANGKISTRSQRVCSSCLKYAAEQLKKQSKTSETVSNNNNDENFEFVENVSVNSQPSDASSPEVQAVIELIEKGEISENDRIKLIQQNLERLQ